MKPTAAGIALATDIYSPPPEGQGVIEQSSIVCHSQANSFALATTGPPVPPTLLPNGLHFSLGAV
eukprot:10708905-Heterocapsa_arctica.AAC.1